MCRWKNWILPGVLTVAILSLLALWLKSGAIESELKAKAEGALSAQGHAWAKVDMDGRDATVSGLAPSEAMQGVAASITDRAYDVRVVANRTELMAAQSPYVLSAKRDGDAVELNGFVPDAETRAKVIASVEKAVPGATITDNTELARGAPDQLSEIADFGVQQLSGLDTGEMSLSDINLSIKGATPDQEKFGMVNAALAGALPAGAVLAMKEITAPAASPYTWSADYKDNGIVLDGFVPSDAVRQQIASKVGETFPGIGIRDNQKVASGQPAEFEAATSFAIEQLPRFSNGMVSLSDTDLTVMGVSKDSSNYDAAKVAVGSALPAGLALATEKIVPSTVSPYTWNAEYDGKTVTLNGYVPDLDTRSAIVADAKAKLPGISVVDQMQTAAGAPKSFGSASGFALEQLPRFSSGSVSLSNLDLTVTGIAKDSASYDAGKAAVAAALPSRLALANEQISPASISPYTWRADYAGTTTTLSGFVPDNEVRGALMASAKQALGGTVVDQMQIAAGQPTDFESAGRFALEQLPRFSEGAVSLSDLDLSVEGKARDGESYESAKAAIAGSLPASINLASEKISAPVVSPYTWAAVYDGQSTTLNGYVPDNTIRESIVAAAKAQLPGVEVIDKMQIAAGAPSDFQAAGTSALGLLPRFTKGSVSLSNTDLTVKGAAKTEADFGAATDTVNGNLGAGMSLAMADITPAAVSPYTWSLIKGTDAAEQSGYVPSRGFGNSMIQATSATLGKQVTDKQRVAAGAPDNFGNALSAAITAVNKLEDSRASITDTAMLVEGRAASQEDADRIRGEIAASVPANFSVESNITFPEPKPVPQEEVAAEPKEEAKVEPKSEPEPKPKPAPEVAKVEPKPEPEPAGCNIDFAALFDGEKIRFATDRALIRSESNALLNRIANAAKDCPNTRFEIGGHTDWRGREKYNQQLSEARARSVASYLAKAGVPGGNLVAKGYGELRPIRSNKTVEGRAANRRIEFQVLSE